MMPGDWGTLGFASKVVPGHKSLQGPDYTTHGELFHVSNSSGRHDWVPTPGMVMDYNTRIAATHALPWSIIRDRIGRLC